MTPTSEYRTISLSKGLSAKVDAADYDFLVKWKWHVIWSRCTQSFYVEAWDHTSGLKRIKMHRIVMGCTPKDGKQIDHKNGDSLDNRRGIFALLVMPKIR